MWGYVCVSRFLVMDLKVIIFSSVESSCTRLPTGMSKTTKHSWSSWFCSSDIWRGQKLPHCNYLILTWITAAERCKEKVNVAWRRSGVASLWRAYMVSNTLTSNFFPGTFWSVLACTPTQWTGNKLYEPLRIYNSSFTKYAGVPGEWLQCSPGKYFEIWQRNRVSYFLQRQWSYNKTIIDICSVNMSSTIIPNK